MISARRLFANRANAKMSTGPKTHAGKAHASRNALRHGLERPVCCDGGYSGEVEALARMIAGESASKERHASACRIAAAQFELKQIRDARGDLLAATGPDIIGAILNRKLLAKLVPLNRFEQRALARRRFAIQEFDRVGRNERRLAKNNIDFLGNEANGRKPIYFSDLTAIPSPRRCSAHVSRYRPKCHPSTVSATAHRRKLDRKPEKRAKAQDDGRPNGKGANGASAPEGRKHDGSAPRP